MQFCVCLSVNEKASLSLVKIKKNSKIVFDGKVQWVERKGKWVANIKWHASKTLKCCIVKTNELISEKM